jgi:hypothetical protein
MTESDVPFEVPLFCKMKQFLSGLILLAILFITPTISAPLEKGRSVLHRLSPHHELSRRIQAASENRPLNFTFTPTPSGDVPVQIEYGASMQPQTSGFRFSATLLKLGLDDDMVDAERRDTQFTFRSADTYGGRHVVISTPDSVVRALQQRGVSQDDMPQYVRQNVHVADPNTGNQYQLVPDSDREEITSADSSIKGWGKSGISTQEGAVWVVVWRLLKSCCLVIERRHHLQRAAYIICNLGSGIIRSNIVHNRQ